LSHQIEPLPNDLTAAGCGGDPSGVINYDANGEPLALSRCIRGNRANFGFSYDPLGRLREITYPDAEVVSYYYDAAGSLARVPGIVDIQQRDARGRPTRMVYGNGVVRQLEYDANRDWLRQQTDRLGNNNVFDSTYTYEPNGLVKTAVSLANQTDLAIRYDAVRRIKSLSGSQTQSWSYDRSGNTIFNSALGYYTYPVSPVACTTPGGTPGQCKQPHAAQTAGGFSLHYDDNGLMSSMTNSYTGQMRSIDWTLDMLPEVLIDFDGTQTNFEYDAFGNRVVETRGQETIIYFGPLARKSSLTGFTNTYVAGDRVIASKSGGARIWMHHDRNGSVRAVTDANGLVVGRMNYGPFGEVRSAPGQSNRVAKFDGVDIDGGTGLQYVGARFYDPILNRFISPDSIVPSALNTQAMNRYAYNYNNPLVYTDPSGHQPIEITSSYYGASAPSSGFDFSIRGYSTMPGSVLTGVSSVSAPPSDFGKHNNSRASGQVCSACRGSTAIYATPFAVPPMSPSLRVQEAISAGFSYDEALQVDAAIQRISEVPGYSRVAADLTKLLRDGDLTRGPFIDDEKFASSNYLLKTTKIHSFKWQYGFDATLVHEHGHLQQSFLFNFLTEDDDDQVMTETIKFLPPDGYELSAKQASLFGASAGFRAEYFYLLARDGGPLMGEPSFWPDNLLRRKAQKATPVLPLGDYPVRDASKKID
jgi:RHS repeat-associated protein